MEKVKKFFNDLGKEIRYLFTRNSIGISPMLMMDFYKSVHSEMLPDNMQMSVSYYTPRRSRVKRWDKVVNFGLQAFCKQWLIEYFNRYFFALPERVVVEEYKRVLDNTMGKDIYNLDLIVNLHRLGYLPIEIIALPEGAEVPMGCPIFGVANTVDGFAWLPQKLESLISAEVWYPMVCATVAHTYREIVDNYYNLTCDDELAHRRALGNFDFRGDAGVEPALKAASAWLTSFVNTATVPVIPFVEKIYNCDCEVDEVGYGAVSTEHFVMCSNSAVDIDKYPDSEYEYKDIDPHRERVFIKRLLTELFPNTACSCVMDSYDYWNVVENILPTLKEEILNHNGPLLVRGDSGEDPVEVVTQTVFKLWDIFGGTVNKKGYKVLNEHIKALYGDSITIERAERIYQILMENGFAANNVALGVGSYSFQCIEEEGMLKPFTRDTFCSAIKACDAIVDDKEYAIYKDPKTDSESSMAFKKSHRGACRVTYDSNGNYVCEDGLTYAESLKGNLMTPLFRDGKLLRDETLNDIRQRLNHNKF